MLVKEIVYACLDLAKAATSDDSFLNEDHCLFLLKKYRSFLIKKEQERIKNSTTIPSEYDYVQQICLDFEEFDVLDEDVNNAIYNSLCNPAWNTSCNMACNADCAICCDTTCDLTQDFRKFLKSRQQIPKMIQGTTPRFYPLNYYHSIKICYINRDRMRYVGTNKYLKNILYVSVGTDDYLYITSNNPDIVDIETLRMSAVFEDVEEAMNLSCDDEGCSLCRDVMEVAFPMPEHLVPTLIELVVKELVGANYRPKDSRNNADDDLAELASFIRNNVKSALQKQIQG